MIYIRVAFDCYERPQGIGSILDYLQHTNILFGINVGNKLNYAYLIRRIDIKSFKVYDLIKKTECVLNSCELKERSLDYTDTIHICRFNSYNATLNKLSFDFCRFYVFVRMLTRVKYNQNSRDYDGSFICKDSTIKPLFLKSIFLGVRYRKSMVDRFFNIKKIDERLIKIQLIPE